MPGVAVTLAGAAGADAVLGSMYNKPLASVGSFGSKSMAVESSWIVCQTCTGVNVGLLCSKRAATPATCGAAMEVPLRKAASLVFRIHADSTLDPGA